MFKAAFEARLMSQAEDVYKGKKGGREQKRLSIKLNYTFDQALAESIGGDAVKVQQMLSNGDDRPSRLAGAPLHLDTNKAEVWLFTGDEAAPDEELYFKTTMDLSGRVSAAMKAGGPDLSLDITISVELGDNAVDVLSFIHRNLLGRVWVKMNRAQQDMFPAEDAAAVDVYNHATALGKLVIDDFRAGRGVHADTKPATIKALLKLAVKHGVPQGDPMMEAVEAASRR